MDTRGAYADSRQHIIDLVADVGGDEPVPCCAGWVVRDVVAHLAGVCDDLLAGRIEGIASEPWTEAQVAARRDRSLPDVVAEWADLGPRLESALGDGLPAQLVFDTVTHEHDLRAALARPGARASDAVEIGFRFISKAWGAALAATGTPAVLVRSDRGERVHGEGPPATTLSGSSFDLLRSFSGRRTLEQVAVLDWGGTDPAPWLGTFRFAVFRPPSEQVDPTT